MDHSEAIRLGAAEKYQLGELTLEKREEFEEHFFACIECASDVKALAVFADNARAVLAEESEVQRVLKPAPRRSVFAWFRPAWGVAAFVVLAGVISYQNLVTIPQLKSQGDGPQALASFSLITGASRGAGVQSIRPERGRPFGIYVDIPPMQSYPYYSVQLKSANRQVEVRVPAEQAKDTVQVLVPADALEAGSAELIISGQAADGHNVEVARSRFDIQYQ